MSSYIFTYPKIIYNTKRVNLNKLWTGGSTGKEFPWMQETWVQPLCWEDPLEKGKVYPLQYSGLENSMGCIDHDVTKSQTWLKEFHSLSLGNGLILHWIENWPMCELIYANWRRKWQPTPVFLPGESQGQRSQVGCCLWGCTESDMTEVS